MDFGCVIPSDGGSCNNNTTHFPQLHWWAIQSARSVLVIADKPRRYDNDDSARSHIVSWVKNLPLCIDGVLDMCWIRPNGQSLPVGHQVGGCGGPIDAVAWKPFAEGHSLKPWPSQAQWEHMLCCSLLGSSCCPSPWQRKHLVTKISHDFQDLAHCGVKWCRQHSNTESGDTSTDSLTIAETIGRGWNTIFTWAVKSASVDHVV